jgi:6-phosphogluconolactonase (cycloisomerase 2 family)
MGTGAGLGNQSGLVLTENGRWLLAVNAGSAEVSLFEVAGGDVLVLRDIVPSGGATPLSIAVDHNLVYVLNGGGSAAQPDNITGFVLTRDDGRLTPLPGSTRTLSGDAVGPAQIGFNPRGSVLVVTEKGTNLVTTFTVDDDGLASTAIPQASSGETPFGFAFDRRGRLFVSEAFGGAPDISALSSYNVGWDGSLTTITGSAATHQTAACWVALDKSGRHAYTTNTGSSSLTGFRIAHDGSLTLIDADGATAKTPAGSGPIDMALTNDGRFLYTLAGGTNTISGFRVKANGDLDPVETQGGLPAGTSGLVAR